jgi:nitroreductase
MPAPFDLVTVDRLLTTTRAVRRRLDLARPVEREVLLDCIRLAQQAPSGENRQPWRWVVVTDPATRNALGAIYAKGIPAIRASAANAADPRPHREAEWLAERLGEVPALVLPCVVGRPPATFLPILCSSIYGSILPAVWSFQLALRSRGLGSVLTTLHLLFEDEVGALLGIPADVLQVALLPVAYTRGTDFRAARRPPVETITYFNSWGS